MKAIVEQFHFIRPVWLLTLIPLLIISLILLRRKLYSHNWLSEVDPALLPYLLLKQDEQPNTGIVFAFFLTGLLMIIAMAGPSWEKLPQPVFKKQAALIIAIDLSPSMDAIDIKPSRLLHAKSKISEILNRRREGQTGLIVYSANTFTVSPISDDTETIDALLASLSTDIMPAKGKNISDALHKSVKLMNNAGFERGDILIVADGFPKESEKALTEVTGLGFRVSMLAVGTTHGAPIPLENGDFLKDNDGELIVPKLELSRLRLLIESYQGLFKHLSVNTQNIEALLPLIKINTLQGDSVATEVETDSWREFGPMLLLLVLPLAALAFRRGYLFIAVLFIFPIAKPIHAWELNELFTSNNEKAITLFNDNQFEAAAKLFDDKQWKAVANYRAAQYEKSSALLEEINIAEAHYNRGNALTQQNQLGNAIAAYSKALELNPKHEDAQYNRALLVQKRDKESPENHNPEYQTPEYQEEGGTQQPNDSTAGDSGQINPEQQNEDQQEANESPEPPPKTEQQTETEAIETDQQNQSPSQIPSKNELTNQEREQQAPSQGGVQEEDQKQSQDEQLAVSQDPNQPLKADERPQEADSEGPQKLPDDKVEQWLSKVPDDPGGLLRRKFKYLYKRQLNNKVNDK